MPNQKGFSKIAIIIIILILIGGAYFVFSKKDENVIVQNAKNQNSQSSNSSTDQLSTDNWKTYKNDRYGFEVEYPENIFKLDKNTNTLSHRLNNFHKYSAKDSSDLGLANDISIVFKRENDKGCNWLETGLNLKSIGSSFEFKNIKGVKYETGAEGEGVVYYCVKNKNKDNQNVFLIERWFLNASYSTDLLKQADYIDGGKQEEIFNRIISTFKFTK